jgi:tetratricopeptide (TPR) repeat protein
VVSLPIRHSLVTWLALGLTLGLPGEALQAQEITGGMPRAGEPSWADYAAPERRVARQLRRDGLVRLLDAQRTEPDSIGPPPEVLFEQALVRFSRARRALAHDPDLLYFTALALAGWSRDVGGREERRTEEAIAAFEELRALDPDYHPDRVALELAALQYRRGELRAAATEYGRAIERTHLPPAPTPYLLTDRESELALLFTPVRLEVAHRDRAECLMLLGELGEAVQGYRRALELSRSGTLEHVLTLWGLALALDRSGDHREALATARRAIEGDPFARAQPGDHRLRLDRRAHGPMAILHSRRLVLFEPSYEVHAYDGLGWEALASLDEGRDPREDLLRRARLAWTSYLTGGGNASVHAEHASRAAARLDAELGAR